MRDTGDWRFWFIIALVFKAAIFLFQISQDRPNHIDGFIGHATDDSETYLEPIDNFLLNGNYIPDERMPGYAVAYLPLRMLFAKSTACNIVIMLQVLAAALSVYYLALTAMKAFRSAKLFYLVFYTFCVSSYSNLFDAYLLTESICTTATIFSVYFFVSYLREERLTLLIYSGLSLTWVIFLRPVYAPLILLLVFILLISILRSGNQRNLMKAIVIFVAPFVVFESAWIVRNYNVHERFIPVTPTLYSSKITDSYTLELMNFVKSWGGDRTWWNPDSEMQWFGIESSSAAFLPPPEISIPDYIYTSRFNEDSLRLVRGMILRINDPQTSQSDRHVLLNEVNKKLRSYTESIRNEKLFLYYVKAPILLLKRFLVHSGTYNLFNKAFHELSYFEKFVKIFYSIFYISVITIGTAALLFAFITYRQQSAAVLIVSLCLYTLILFPIILRQIEFRYLVPAYPFLLVMACYQMLMSRSVLQSLFSARRVKGL